MMLCVLSMRVKATRATGTQPNEHGEPESSTSIANELLLYAKTALCLKHAHKDGPRGKHEFSSVEAPTLARGPKQTRSNMNKVTNLIKVAAGSGPSRLKSTARARINSPDQHLELSLLAL